MYGRRGDDFGADRHLAMEEDKIMRTELGPDELLSAWRQAVQNGQKSEAEELRRRIMSGVLEKSMSPSKARFGGGNRA